MIILIMGPCGAGKSTVGRALAEALGAHFIEGDDYHSATNIAKMRGGLPLDDQDRTPWLDALAAELATAHRDGRSVVLACSALKQAYRDRLSADVPTGFEIVLLDAPRELLSARLRARTRHFMSAEMLDSQLAIFERPRDAFVADARQSSDAIVGDIMQALGATLQDGAN